MTTTLETIRARARAHEEELLALRWFTPQELADRWRIARSTVAEIPHDRLRYKEFGAGAKLKRRRYREDWVLAYEDAEGLAPADPETPA